MAVSLISTGVQFPDSTIQTTASGASGLNLITTVTASGASTADVENAMTAYDRYMITLENVTGSVNPASLVAQFKLGGAYSTASYYSTAPLFTSSSSSTSYFNLIGQSFGGLSANNMYVATNYYLNGEFYLSKPSTTNAYKQMWGKTAYIFDGGGIARQAIPYMYNEGSAAALTGVRFYMQSGTISGTFRLYGFAK